MKFTIFGLQQNKLIDANLDLNDALILDTIAKMNSTAGFEYIIDEGDKYTWVNQTYLSNYLPILGSKRQLQRRIRLLEDTGFIKRVVKHSKQGNQGTFSYIQLTDKYTDLTEFEPEQPEGTTDTAYPIDTTNVAGGTTDTAVGVRQIGHNKDSPYLDSPLEDYVITGTIPKKLLDEIVSKWNEASKMNIRGVFPNTDRYILTKARLNEGKEHFLKMIEIVSEIPFLQKPSKYDNKQGKRVTFRPSYDWCVVKANYDKILEGAYYEVEDKESDNNGTHREELTEEQHAERERESERRAEDELRRYREEVERQKELQRERQENNVNVWDGDLPY